MPLDAITVAVTDDSDYERALSIVRGFEDQTEGTKVKRRPLERVLIALLLILLAVVLWLSDYPF